MVDAFFKLFEDHPLNLKPDDVIGIKQIDPGKYLFYIDIRTLNHRNLEKCNSGGLCSDVQISLKKSLDIL